MHLIRHLRYICVLFDLKFALCQVQFWSDPWFLFGKSLHSSDIVDMLLPVRLQIFLAKLL